MAGHTTQGVTVSNNGRTPTIGLMNLDHMPEEPPRGLMNLD